MAKALGVSRPTVATWRGHFAAHRSEGLTDAPRSGAPRTIGDETVERLVALTLEEAPSNATHWSTRAMARRAGMSQTAVSRSYLRRSGSRRSAATAPASISRKADLVVPPRRNGKPWKARTAGAGERNETLRTVRRLGRRLWKRWSGYNRRSPAETAMSRLKRLGERLSARDPARQVAEVQIRCAILNTFDSLGMPNTVARA